MTGKEVLRRLRSAGGEEVRQRGSHVRVRCRCGRYSSTVPVHAGADVSPGTLRGIERDLEPCLGKGWLRG
ncbi:MAG: type II toxin-antitoxin system HicA family toxin [Planctomycetes bacterium]|nr:type II toxin-antitoxin system HicA family toxin [Planctomycetota bacterium]